jgi:hypothetical protein
MKRNRNLAYLISQRRTPIFAVSRPNRAEVEHPLLIHQMLSFLTCTFIIMLLCSCTKTETGRISARIENDTTQILYETVPGKTMVLDAYPEFPALDGAFSRRTEYIIGFLNGSAAMIVPDKSVKEKILAWNDQSHLFDVIFVDVKAKTISTLFKDNGTNLRIAKADPNEVFVFRINGEICILTWLGENGLGKMQIQYQFQSYPDIVSVNKSPTGYQIIHDNIDNQETFLFDSAHRKIQSISYLTHK